MCSFGVHAVTKSCVGGSSEAKQGSFSTLAKFSPFLSRTLVVEHFSVKMGGRWGERESERHVGEWICFVVQHASWNMPILTRTHFEHRITIIIDLHN